MCIGCIITNTYVKINANWAFPYHNKIGKDFPGQEGEGDCEGDGPMKTFLGFGIRFREYFCFKKLYFCKMNTFLSSLLLCVCYCVLRMCIRRQAHHRPRALFLNVG